MFHPCLYFSYQSDIYVHGEHLLRVFPKSAQEVSWEGEGRKYFETICPSQLSSLVLYMIAPYQVLQMGHPQ